MDYDCVNFLYISGEKKLVDQFLEDNNNTLDFNDYIPYPKKLHQCDQDYSLVLDKKMTKQEFKKKWGSLVDGYNNEGHNWCSDNWGTKWNTYDVSILKEFPGCYYYETLSGDGDARIVFVFGTAGSPPIPVIKKIMTKYNDVLFMEFEWFARGIGFCGSMHVEEEDPRDYSKDLEFIEKRSEYFGFMGV